MQTSDGINCFLLFLNKLSFSKADANQKLKEAQMNLPRTGPRKFLCRIFPLVPASYETFPSHTRIIATLYFRQPFTRSSSLQLLLLTSQFESAAVLCLTLARRTKITELQGKLQHLCSFPPYSLLLLTTTSRSFSMKYQGREGEIQVKELF